MKDAKCVLFGTCGGYVDVLRGFRHSTLGDVNSANGLVHGVVPRIAVTPRAPGNFPLQVLVRPATEFLGVVEDLTDDRSAGFGIAPEPGLERHELALRRRVECVDGTGRGIQLHPDGHRMRKGAINFVNGRRVGVPEEELLHPRFVVVRRRPGAGQRDPLKRLRAATGRDRDG